MQHEKRRYEYYMETTLKLNEYWSSWELLQNTSLRDGYTKLYII